MQDHRGHDDRWPLGQVTLDHVEAWITCRIAVTMPVRVDDDLDEIRVVERWRGPLERGVVESPGRRPVAPQEPADLATVRLEAGPAAVHVEVPLVPEGPLLDGGAGARRLDRVLYVVTADVTSARTRSGAKMLAMHAARPPQSYPARPTRGRWSASISSSRSWPIAACCAIRGVAESRIVSGRIRVDMGRRRGSRRPREMPRRHRTLGRHPENRVGG